MKMEKSLWARTNSMGPLPGFMSLILTTLLGLPLVAVILRGVTGSAWLGFSDEYLLAAISLTLVTTLSAAAVIFVFGTPLAYFLARTRFRFKRALTVLVELPIILPPTVAGLALLLAAGRRGLLGGLLGDLGISLPFTTLAVIVAEVFVASPYYVRSAQVGFASVPISIEEAARIDGASPWQVFTRITFPLAIQSVLTGLSLSWARALGEFGATLMFAGNITGRTQTMTLFIYNAFESNLDGALAASLILLALGALTLFASQMFTSPALES